MSHVWQAQTATAFCFADGGNVTHAAGPGSPTPLVSAAATEVGGAITLVCVDGGPSGLQELWLVRRDPAGVPQWAGPIG